VTGPLNTTPPGAGTTTTPPSTTNPALTSTQDQSIDTNLDGIVDDQDNCPTLSNPDQTDSDADSLGDVCGNEDNTVSESEQPMSPDQDDNIESTETGEQGSEESVNEDGNDSSDGGDSNDDSNSEEGQ
jgi:hypothetical protein